MMGKTHMAIGLLAGLMLFPFFNQPWFYFIPLVVLGSLLPDVDHENSKINRIVPLTRWIPTIFSHRGFFHSIFPAVIIYFGFHYAKLDIVGIPLAIGYSSHLLSDCFTRNGCNLLHPVSTFRIQGPIMTNGLMELITLGSVLLLDALLVVKHIF
ncbi:MAG: metal-dependent hydrolase [Candidatus Woesearchaeota archaeon]